VVVGVAGGRSCTGYMIGRCQRTGFGRHYELPAFCQPGMSPYVLAYWGGGGGADVLILMIFLPSFMHVGSICVEHDGLVAVSENWINVEELDPLLKIFWGKYSTSSVSCSPLYICNGSEKEVGGSCGVLSWACLIFESYPVVLQPSSNASSSLARGGFSKWRLHDGEERKRMPVVCRSVGRPFCML